MGNFCGSCFKGRLDSRPYIHQIQCARTCNNIIILLTFRFQQETRRQQLAIAAEKRLHEQNNRGIKNPENVMRKQQLALKRENAERNNQSYLRWTTED